MKYHKYYFSISTIFFCEVYCFDIFLVIIAYFLALVLPLKWNSSHLTCYHYKSAVTPTSTESMARVILVLMRLSNIIVEWHTRIPVWALYSVISNYFHVYSLLDKVICWTQYLIVKPLSNNFIFAKTPHLLSESDNLLYMLLTWS